MSADVLDGTRHAPLGEGLSLVRLSLAPSDVVVLRGILAGYDGLASVHGDESGVVALVTPDAMLAELESVLESLRGDVPFERLD